MKRGFPLHDIGYHTNTAGEEASGKYKLTQNRWFVQSQGGKFQMHSDYWIDH